MSHADKMRQVIESQTYGRGKTTGICQAIKPDSCKKVEKYCSVSNTPRPGGVPYFGPGIRDTYKVPMVSEEYCTKKRGGPEIDKKNDEFYNLIREEDIVDSLYKQKTFAPVYAPDPDSPPAAANAAPATAAPAAGKSKKSSSYKCADIRQESCHKFEKYCEVPYDKLGYAKSGCIKIRGGPKLDSDFDLLIKEEDLYSPEEKQKLKEEEVKQPKLRKSFFYEPGCSYIIPKFCDNYDPYCKKTTTGKCLKKKGGPYFPHDKVILPEHHIKYIEEFDRGPEFIGSRVIHPEHRVGYVAPSNASKPIKPASSYSRPTEPANLDGDLSEVQVPSSANLVVSDLPKSNSGVGKTEQVMEQVMAANVSKGMLSRQKSVEILASPAAQHYVDLRQHLTQDEVRQLDADMTAVHSGVETILAQRLSSADEKKTLQKLFDEYDLCKYVRTADDKKLTIPKLTAILESFGQVEKRVRLATTRSTICYIILSVVLMDPKTFIEKLSGINKGSYSKK